MNALKIMLFSALLIELAGCSTPQTSENSAPSVRSQTSSEPQDRLSVVWGVLLNTLMGWVMKWPPNAWRKHAAQCRQF